MEQGRRAAGRALEDARRAGGQQMEATRRGEAVAEDINSLVRPQRQARTLPRVTPVGALPAQRSSADYKAPANTGTAGIASPLIEGAAGEGATLAREYYAGITLTSSDGLISLDVEPLKKLTMRDANGEPVVMEFAQP
ncbi:hypothetical protein EJA06_004680 [Pseudomonas songnenensis]|uniref:Uncharacterized protein n=1 Tax=Pseudomonas songnenensis TaxID=1176259 RepID=A0A482UJE0_9PSED|nr:hypothetical protein EJA06_004680 [Pseudomonas songnenensis]